MFHQGPGSCGLAAGADRPYDPRPPQVRPGLVPEALATRSGRPGNGDGAAR